VRLKSAARRRSGSIHRAVGVLQPDRNKPSPSFASRRSGASRRIVMDIVAIVMLGSVALWLAQQFEG
jgi:hypothetical protein